MDNSIYVALSRQLTVMRDMEMTANNIANANTPGYNAEKMMFTDYVVNEGNRNKLAFTQDLSSYRDTRSGPMKVTGNPLDMAIQGPGFFVVETAQGERYTKAGNFTKTNDGTLVTQTGQPVLTVEGQQIVLNASDRNITIGENGVVSVINQDGITEDRGQIGVVEFENEQEMKRLDNQLYETQQAPIEAENSRVLQGTIEGANISAVSELVRTTELSRSTSSTAKFIEVMYDLQRKTSNAYARPAQS